MFWIIFSVYILGLVAYLFYKGYTVGYGGRGISESEFVESLLWPLVTIMAVIVVIINTPFILGDKVETKIKNWKLNKNKEKM